MSLHRTICRLLDDRGPISNIKPYNHITDFDFHQIAAAQLPIDCEVEKSSIPQSSLAIEMKADRPDLLLG